ncbi:MORN repeat-containing protein 5-like [Anthonomus grandis grandis]|uniref:MORN repeat-containing protein 5-like n=1 Tax=Anthonomus grandis grandis TaxID=2921223 RepID=UPI002166739A|nr:MORN repeat-containing protein 5-like [Anthonomus grandis grandis]
MTTSNKKWVSPKLTPDWAHIDIGRRKSIFRRVGENVHPGLIKYIRPNEHFVTGSSYQGFWDSLGFSGQGTYVYPHGAIYQGNFKDGQFHGRGTILYPRGHKLKGLWEKGKLIDKIFVFGDGLEVTDPWTYCQMPDRRFQTEFNTALRGAGGEYLTNKQPTVEIPEGCYDTIDGFYDPGLRSVFNYPEQPVKITHKNEKGADSLKRICQQEESATIEKFYRKAELEPIEYRPDLYEYWTTGLKAEVEKIKTEYQNLKENKEEITTVKDEESLKKYMDLEYEPDPKVTVIYENFK